VGRARESARIALDQLAGRHDRVEAAALAGIGVTCYWAGEHEAAAAHLRTACEIGSRYGEMSSVVFAHGYLALLSTGDEAETHAHAALALCDTADKEVFLAPVAALLALARTGLDQRRLDAADQALTRAQAIAAPASEPLAHAVCTAWQGELAHLRGDTTGGRALLREAEQALTRLPDPGHASQLIRTAAAALRFAPRPLDSRDRPTPPLTERELTVLRLLPGTITRQELANELHISLATVKTHMHAIARKLGVSTRTEIVQRARELGLLP
jgi:LuxR family maltose regulon positive regulatory protein